MAGVGLYDMRVTVDFCDRRVLGGNLRKGVKGGLKEEKGWDFDRVFGVGMGDRRRREMEAIFREGGCVLLEVKKAQ